MLLSLLLYGLLLSPSSAYVTSTILILSSSFFVFYSNQSPADNHRSSPSTFVWPPSVQSRQPHLPSPPQWPHHLPILFALLRSTTLSILFSHHNIRASLLSLLHCSTQQRCLVSEIEFTSSFLEYDVKFFEIVYSIIQTSSTPRELHPSSSCVHVSSLLKWCKSNIQKISLKLKVIQSCHHWSIFRFDFGLLRDLQVFFFPLDLLVLYNSNSLLHYHSISACWPLKCKIECIALIICNYQSKYYILDFAT